MGKENEVNGDKYVAIDFGAESGRLILGYLQNGKLAMEEIHRFKTQGTMIRGQLRWNVLRLWEEVLTGLQKYVKKFGPKVNGMGVDSWGVSPVGLDEYGNLAYTPFHYRASLVADPMLEEFQKQIGADYIFDITGIQFMALNTSTQLFAMEKKYPHLLSRVETIFLIPDYFYYLLSGKKLTEYTNASTTQLLDVRKRNWSSELIDKIGPNCNADKFPPLHSPGKKIGPITAEVQRETGLQDATLHLVATHDTGSAIAAIPHVDDDKTWAYLSSGTWSLLGVECPEPIISQKVKEYNLTNEGGVDNTIRLLKNIMGLWLLQECKREWEEIEGKDLDYGNLTQDGANSQAFQSLIFPDDGRFFSPESMVEEIRQYCKETNQEIPHGKPEIIRCIFESLACRYREVVEMLEEVTEQKIEQIHIVGGGSQNKLLSQMTANACNKTVITGPVEATAIGNLLIQAKSDKKIDSLHDLRVVVKNSFDVERLEPRPELIEKWNKHYEKYKKIQNG